jgi:hypothetical protein
MGNWPQLALARASTKADSALFTIKGRVSVLLTRARKGLSRPLQGRMPMIDPSMIEEFEDCDGESVHCLGVDAESGNWRWEWVPVETLMEAGRGDLLPWLAA